MAFLDSNLHSRLAIATENELAWLRLLSIDELGPERGLPLLEVVNKFCYLGDTLSVDGDADAAVQARIRIGWN